MSDIGIVIDNVSKAFANVTALKGVSLEIPAGVAFGLVGPNGAGKSTLFRILSGLSRPDTGNVRLAGVDPAAGGAALQALLGCVPDNPPLFDLLTGAEHAALVGRLHGLSEGLLTSRMQELAQGLDLQEAMQRPAGGYSKGMRQKLAFLCAVIHDPRILILDEVFEGVDPWSVEAMKTMLAQFVAAGAVVVVSSHILAVLQEVCSQFAIIDQGQIVFHGTRDTIDAEAARLDQSEPAAGRGLERVFLQIAAKGRTVNRLKTLAQPAPRSDSHAH